MKKMMTVAVLALALGLTACGESAEPAAEAEPAKAEKTEAAPKKKTVKVDAAKLLSEYEANEAKADAKYKGKVLQVAGVVDKVDTDLFDSNKYVVRVSDGSEFAFLTVNCNDVPADVAVNIDAGADVTVRGDFKDGGDLGIEIKNCKVL